MNKKVMKLVIVLVLGLLLSSGVFAQAQPFKGVTISVPSCEWSSMSIIWDQAKDIAKDLGINLRVAYFAFADQRTKLLLDTKMNLSTWDVVYIDTKWIPEFAEADVIEPLAKYADPKSLDDYYPSVINIAHHNNILYAIPVAFTHVTGVYRADLFENAEEKAAFKKEYGYELAPPQTYSEFMDIAKFFTRKKGEKLAGKILDADFYGTIHSNKRGGFLFQDYVCYMYAFGGKFVDPETMKVVFNSPEQIKAIKYYKELLSCQPPGTFSMSSGEATAWFASGNVAMQIEWSDRLADILGDPAQSKVIGKYKYMLLPTEEASYPHVSLFHTEMLGVYSHSQNKEAAFALIDKIASAQATKERTTTTKFIPVTKSILEDNSVISSKDYLRNVANSLGGNVKMITEHDFAPYPFVLSYEESLDLVEAELAEVLLGNKTAEEAAKAAEAKLIDLYKSRDYLK